MTKTETNGPKMSEIMLRSTIKIKKTSPFILYCAHFFVPLQHILYVAIKK